MIFCSIDHRNRGLTFTDSHRIFNAGRRTWDRKPLVNVNKKRTGKSPCYFIMGKLTISTGPFPIAILTYITRGYDWARSRITRNRHFSELLTDLVLLFQAPFRDIGPRGKNYDPSIKPPGIGGRKTYLQLQSLLRVAYF